MFLFQSWLARGAFAILFALVVAVGAWWLFIRSDAELASAPLDFRDTDSAEAASATSTPPVADADDATAETDLAGVTTYRIVASHDSVDGATEAAYFADEQFASLSVPSTARGATQDVSGELYLDAGGIAEGAESRVVVALSGLRSDESRRDNRVQGALDVANYPEATFVPSALDGYGGEIPDGGDVEYALTGLLTLRGVEREVTWDVVARRNGDIVTALATVTVRYDEFDIPPPIVAGFVSVEDEVTLQLQLIAAQA